MVGTISLAVKLDTHLNFVVWVQIKEGCCLRRSQNDQENMTPLDHTYKKRNCTDIPIILSLKEELISLSFYWYNSTNE